METKTKEQEFRDSLAVSREIYEQSVKGIDEEIKRLYEQKELLRKDLKTRNAELNKKYNSPTPESIRKRRKAEAYRIQRFIGGNLLDWKSEVLNGETSRVTFELQDEQVVLTVTVPHKPYEFKDAE